MQKCYLFVDFYSYFYRAPLSFMLSLNNCVMFISSFTDILINATFNLSRNSFICGQINLLWTLIWPIYLEHLMPSSLSEWSPPLPWTTIIIINIILSILITNKFSADFFSIVFSISNSFLNSFYRNLKFFINNLILKWKSIRLIIVLTLNRLNFVKISEKSSILVEFHLKYLFIKWFAWN